MNQNQSSLQRHAAIWAAAALAWCAIPLARADTVVWTPAVGSQNWFLSTNWRALLPTTADVAVVNAGTVIVQGGATAVASSLSITGGGVTVGDLEAGTLNVGGQISVSGGRLALTFGSVSFNTLAVGTGGSYADTRAGTLNLTGLTPGITVGATSIVVNSQIAGTAGLNLVGPGSVALTNTNSYSGGTAVSTLSTLIVGNGGATGTLGAGEVRNQGTLVLGRTDAAVVTNLISGTGSVVQAGSGTSTLTADNSYSGGTTISAGTLQVGNGGTTGALGSGAISNNGSLVFNRSDDVVLAAVISGTGSLAQNGSNKLTLTGNNTFSGVTTISSGTLQVGAGGTTGSLGAGNVTNNAALIINRNDNVAVAGIISGTGSLTHAGTGTLTLGGNNTYSGPTVISSGILQVGSGGATGSLGSSSVTNNGAIVVNRTGAVLIPGVISGSGSLTQSGPGVTVLSGNNTYSGGTTISAGTLVVGNAGAAGTLGTGNVVNNGVLAFDRTDSLLVSNVISGTGSVRQAGTGLVSIAADNSYAGGTTISAGTLQVGIGGTAGSLGTGDITNNAALSFNRSDDVLVVSVISGTGSLAQIGGGKLTLFANNTYSGSTLVGSGATVQVGLGSTTGSLGTGAVVNNGVLTFNRSDAVTVNNSISGIGSLVQAGSGTITLLGNNTYATGTTIGAGTVQVGNGGVVGSLGSGTVANQGTLILNRSDNLVVANLITGSGSLQQVGPGTVALTGNNTYSGTTTIRGGTLQVGNGGTVGVLGSGDVVNHGTLAFNRSDTLVFSNPLSGSGGLQQSGLGTLILTGSNSLSGTTQISAGTLQVGNGGTTGTLGTGGITNNSRLTFNRSDTVVVDGAMSGTGSLTQSGTGLLILGGDNTYTGTTTINSGRLQVGVGGTTGSLGAGAIANNGVLTFMRSDLLVVGGGITGTGSVQQMGTGTVRIASNSTYSGGTLINSGTLQVGDGGVAGSLGTGGITNNGQLIFNRSDALSIDNLIEGNGRVRHSGGGTLTLARSNTYSGGTFVDGGGTLRVLSGSSLGSGDLTLTRGAIRADAASLTARTTLAVGGNYTQAAGTELELGVGGTTAGLFDQVRISGRANLNGTLRLTALGTYRPVHNTQLTVLSATGGVVGQFSAVTNSVTVSPLLNLQVKYNPNDVTLYWGHASFVPYAATDSQRAVATALDSIVTSTAAADVALIDRLDYDFISNLRPGLQGAFDAIAPDGLTAMFGTSFAVMDLQGDQFLKRANELLADYPSVYSAALRDQAASAQAFDAYVKNPWSVYVELPFSSIGVDATGSTKGYDVKTRGVRFGLDRRLGEHFFVGLSGGANSSKADVTGGTEVDASGYGVDAYAVWSKQGLHLLGMVGGSVSSMDTKRQTLGGVASGTSDGLGWTGLFGGGYDVQKGAWKIGGQATIQYMRAEIDPFTETGSLSPLQVLSQSAESVHTQVGASIRHRQMIGPWTILTPQLYVGWRHELQSDRLALDSQFAGKVGQAFTVYGPKLGTDSIVGSAGLSVQWRPAVNTALNYTRQVGRSGYKSENFQLAARLSF